MGLSSCQNLKSIDVEDGNPQYYSLDGVLFCLNDTLVAYPGGGNAEYTIPSNVKALGASSFEGSNIQKIVFPDGLKYIGKSAFASSKLTSAKIPSSVETISNYAFSNCPLTEVTLPEGLTVIASGAFSDTSLASVVIPNSVQKISRDAFASCLQLSSLTLGTGLLTIVPYAFAYCRNLQEVFIPARVKYIDANSFVGCRLQKFVVDEANENFSSVEGVLMNKEKTALHTFPAGLTGEYTVPSSVHKISDYAFLYSLLSKVDLCESVTEVSQSAFFSSRIETVVLPNSLTNIGKSAFSYCTGLKEIYSKISEPFVLSATDIFASDDDESSSYNKAVLYVPTGTKDKYMSTDYWNLFKNIVEYDVTSVDRVDSAVAPVEVARYNVSCQRMSSAEKGLGIVKMSDGTVRKIFR